eukprot:TRINITY_DN10850_c0_g1_i1.p1 TRINITY_DN10850_c0_g1~~TRINITY_DN10850_c0_g1_i1.p1  ORF type:complete len:106 (-),score=2.53 TRINITY_DN10850_c0_g1_i1:78-395(-)
MLPVGRPLHLTNIATVQCLGFRLRATLTNGHVTYTTDSGAAECLSPTISSPLFFHSFTTPFRHAGTTNITLRIRNTAMKIPSKMSEKSDGCGIAPNPNTRNQYAP